MAVLLPCICIDHIIRSSIGGGGEGGSLVLDGWNVWHPSLLSVLVVMALGVVGAHNRLTQSNQPLTLSLCLPAVFVQSILFPSLATTTSHSDTLSPAGFFSLQGM